MLVLSSLVVGLAMAVAYISMAANAQSARATSPAAPALNETWFPAPNTPLQYTGDFTTAPPLFVQVTRVSPTAFYTPSFYYRVYRPYSASSITHTVDEVSLTPDGYTAYITATNIPVWGTGEQVQFAVFYSGTLDYGSVTYPVSVTYSAYAPAVYRNYPPLVNQGYNPCDAIPAAPLTPYSIAQDAPYRFFSMTVPTTSTVYMTVTSYSLSGQMQFRTPPPVGDCVPTHGTTLNYTVISTNPTIQAYNVLPGSYLGRFSSDNGVTSTAPFTFTWNYVPAAGLNEPNNTFCTATPVNIGTTYPDYPEDSYDFFGFNVTTTQNIYINLSNYTGNPGQMQLIQQTTNCSDNAGMVVLNTANLSGLSSGVITQTNVTAGRYYLMVWTGGNFNTATPYQFTITSDIGVWAPQIDLCPAFTGCSDHAVNSSVTVYWRGVPGATEIDINFNGATTGNCIVGSFFDVINASSNPPVSSYTPAGNKTYSNLATGYYAVNVTIKRPGYPNGFDSKPLKVNCETLYNQLQPWPRLTPTPTGGAIGPVQPHSSAPQVTPVPLPVIAPETKSTPAP